MRVDIRRGRNITVAQPLLNLLHRHALFQQQAGAGMAQIVKANPAQTILFQQLRKACRYGIRLEQISHCIHKYIAKVFLIIAVAADFLVVCRFAPQGDFYTTTLEAEKMPSGKTMYQNMIKKQNADVIEPAKLSSFDLLLEYLKLPDAERVFKGQAYAYSLSLLEPALMKNNLAFNNWETIVKAVNDQTHFTNANFVFPGTIFGSWIPRTSNAHLAIHSAILASELKAEGAVAVCAVLNDEKDRRTDKYEQEWNGLWRFYNVMQFSDEFIAVSSVGMSHMDYLALPVAINADSDIVAPVAAVDDAWNAIKELLFDDDAKAFVEIAKDAGVPAPDEDNIGYEVEGDDGEVVATVEIAWPDRRIGFMTAEQAEDKEKLEKLGWRIEMVRNALI